MKKFSRLKLSLFCLLVFSAINDSWEEAVRKSVSYKTEPLEGKTKVTKKRLGKNLNKKNP